MRVALFTCINASGRGTKKRKRKTQTQDVESTKRASQTHMHKCTVYVP